MRTSYRTHTCGELTSSNIGEEVKLTGFVDSVRTHGRIGFINLKDRYGITQIFFKGELSGQLESIRKESVLQIGGEVVKRPENLINKEIHTGEIEVSVSKLNLINNVPELPLQLDGKASEDTRLKYRYLDLRMETMQKNLKLRHKLIFALREFLDKENFIEIETPVLAKSTPEGARDYLVPSRLHKGNFYALPQSPQLFKQLLMIAGYDRYFQVARCFRDEDLRADRQPEFTQLDLEMSFVDENDIYDLHEKMLKYVFKKVLNYEIEIPFQRITYQESMAKYKTDQPDLRKNEKFKFVWITDFPLFEYSEEEKKHVPVHHPFTNINPDDRNKLGKSYDIRSRSYDLVLNGWELGSGSVRISDHGLQKRVFHALNITEEEAKDKFGFFLEALKFAPPHAGFAVGLDRLIALVSESKSIREVIAFPKNKFAKDVMLDAPSPVSNEQLADLKLK